MQSANLALRFLLEIAALAAVAWTGYQIVDAVPLRWILPVVGVGVFVALWGTFVSPRAPQRLRDPAKAVLEGFLFAAAASALVFAGLPGLGVLLAVFAAGNIALMFYFSQRDL